MHVVVLGAGIIGVATAYFLSARGHQVTVIDRESESARQTSFANGGQLSYSHAEPWANPSVLPKAIKWMFKDDAPLLFRPKMDTHTISWLMRFLSQCTQGKADENTKTTLRLGLYSRDVLNELAESTQVKFHYRHRGILHIFKSDTALEGGVRQADFQVPLGAPYERLSAEECLAKEPALKHIAHELKGGLYYHLDESGDIYLFTKELAELEAESGGVNFQFNTDIKKLHTEGNRITAVETDQGMVEGDAYVLALGSYSWFFLRDLGIKVPIYPMKGYSISIPITNKEATPTVSITDQAEKIVYSRLGPILRAAGTAEFAGFNHDIVPKRIKMLKDNARRLFPECGDIEGASEWACLRPQLPDGAALLGRCCYENLMLNTGQGSLGWTLGPGSAKIVADLIDGKEPEIDLTGLTAERFVSG